MNFVGFGIIPFSLPTDIPYNWGADLITRTHSLFGIFYDENLEYCRSIAIH